MAKIKKKVVVDKSIVALSYKNSPPIEIELEYLGGGGIIMSEKDILDGRYVFTPINIKALSQLLAGTGVSATLVNAILSSVIASTGNVPAVQQSSGSHEFYEQEYPDSDVGTQSKPPDNRKYYETKEDTKCAVCGDTAKSFGSIKLDLKEFDLCSTCTASVENMIDSFITCQQCNSPSIPTHQNVVYIHGGQRDQVFVCDEHWKQLRDWLYKQ